MSDKECTSGTDRDGELFEDSVMCTAQRDLVLTLPLISTGCSLGQAIRDTVESPRWGSLGCRIQKMDADTARNASWKPLLIILRLLIQCLIHIEISLQDPLLKMIGLPGRPWHFPNGVLDGRHIGSFMGVCGGWC